MINPRERHEAIAHTSCPPPALPRSAVRPSWEGPLLLGMELAATVHDASGRALSAELERSAARCAREGIPLAAVRQAICEEVTATLPTMPFAVDSSTEHAIRTALITTASRAYTYLEFTPRRGRTP
ncbi:hypothetical protein [Nocardia sp. NPDC058633]|uniref:hypothetical protein n=1 Tax=Nocardia sp. NPDC058633 TaxID=3346568 RepID=UPI0036545C18